MKRTEQERFASAAHSARLIVDRSSNKSIDDCLTDEDLRAKLERWLEKLGEALSQANRSLPNLSRAIPEISAIVGARNRIAHEYDDLNVDIIWKAITQYVPPLIPVLEQLSEVDQRELERLYGA